MTTRKKQITHETTAFQYLILILGAVALLMAFNRMVTMIIENYCEQGYSLGACEKPYMVEWDYSTQVSQPEIVETPDPTAYELHLIPAGSSCYEVPVENHEYNTLACLFVLGNEHYSACHLITYKTVCR